MTTKARHMRSRLHDKAISVDDLFTAAFDNPHFYYQRQSLLGWRPVAHHYKPHQAETIPPSPLEQAPSYTPSPDVTVQDTPEAILVEIILPEIHEESLHIEISGDLLIVKAQKKGFVNGRHESDDKADDAMVDRYVKLPVIAQPGNVQARLKNNVLRVMIVKLWAGRRHP
jgi:HSP20 family molecular chaperone IbpA